MSSRNHISACVACLIEQFYSFKMPNYTDSLLFPDQQTHACFGLLICSYMLIYLFIAFAVTFHFVPFIVYGHKAVLRALALENVVCAPC